MRKCRMGFAGEENENVGDSEKGVSETQDFYYGLHCGMYIPGILLWSVFVQYDAGYITGKRRSNVIGRRYVSLTEPDGFSVFIK